LIDKNDFRNFEDTIIGGKLVIGKMSQMISIKIKENVKDNLIR
jgi:hypothetical protein